mmetsp:Transcript_36911/g.90391  ORF Transcript_36911/g.90391 Transcript_36911/m.90391 type:complete len:314 (-) Transcript_36911:2586-3527(-)
MRSATTRSASVPAFTEDANARQMCWASTRRTTSHSKPSSACASCAHRHHHRRSIRRARRRGGLARGQRRRQRVCPLRCPRLGPPTRPQSRRLRRACRRRRRRRTLAVLWCTCAPVAPTAPSAVWAAWLRLVLACRRPSTRRRAATRSILASASSSAPCVSPMASRSWCAGLARAQCYAPTRHCRQSSSAATVRSRCIACVLPTAPKKAWWSRPTRRRAPPCASKTSSSSSACMTACTWRPTTSASSSFAAHASSPTRAPRLGWRATYTLRRRWPTSPCATLCSGTRHSAPRTPPSILALACASTAPRCTWPTP